MPEESIIRFEIRASSLDDLRAFIDEAQPDLGCRATARQTADGFAIDAYLPQFELDTARGSRAAARVTIRVIENATEVGRERQREVGRGNRYAARGVVPRGLGEKK